MTAVAKQDDDRSVTRPLSVLVPLIKDELRKGEEAANDAKMPYVKRVGALLNEARPQFDTADEFFRWGKRNFDLQRSQSQLYMKYDTTTAGPPRQSYDSIKDFRRRHLGHDVPTSGGGIRQPAWRESVKENVERAKQEAKRLHDEELTRQQERDAERKLALRLIDIGFKILVKELHPDKGGSRDAMARLNRVRDRLKQHA